MTGGIRRSLTLAAALALAVGACSGSATPAPTAAAPTAGASTGATPAPAVETINIGISGPFTGPNALTGTEVKNGVSMAFDAINWTVGNYKINPVYIDDQSDPAKGAAAYEQAVVSQKIIAGVAGWHSSVAVAQMEVTAKYKVPHFFALGAAATVNDKFNSDKTKYGYWTSKGWPNPAVLSVAYVGALNDAVTAGTYTPANKNVAIFGEDTDWGRSFAAGIKKQFVDTGWTISGEDYFPLTQTDFSAIVSKWKSQGVSVIAGTTTVPASVSSLVKQIDDSGVKAVVVADGLGWMGDWYKLTGVSSDYVLDQIPQWATDAAKKFATDYKAKYNTEPSPSAAGLSFDYANYFINILKATIADQGSLTSATIYKEAQDKVWTGQLAYTGGIIMQSYDYTPTSIPDMNVGKGHFIFPVIQYHAGAGTVIWPDYQAAGKLQIKP